MNPLEKPLDQIEETDLQHVKDNKVSERKRIEYKLRLPSQSDREKREFLADVSSFANAAGGDVIYGIRERSGEPVEIVGISGSNPDSEILRLESSIRDGIDPRIPGLQSHAITLSSGAYALIVRIPRSFNAPHRVTFQGGSRFWSRNSAGKYPLDVDELRAAFLLSATVAERARSFRVQRLATIVAGETPVLLEESSKVVLHLVPFGAFEPGVYYDVVALPSHLLPPLRRNSVLSHRINFDGLVTFERYPSRPAATGYVQAFRNGIIEAVEKDILNQRELVIPSISFEERLLRGLQPYLKVQELLRVAPPILVMLSLLGVKGYGMGVSPSIKFQHNYGYPESSDLVIDRDQLILPEILIDTYNVDPGRVMRPVFDAVWNAAGWPQSLNFDENGNWRPHKQ